MTGARRPAASLDCHQSNGFQRPMIEASVRLVSSNRCSTAGGLVQSDVVFNPKLPLAEDIEA